MTNEQFEELMKVQSDIRKELVTIRAGMGKVIFYMTEAEAEVSEKMRRFIMYMHDIHDVKNLYDEHGLEVPKHVLRECERCDDRLRQLLTEAHAEGNVFAKVRAEMAKDPENRWDHTRLLSKPNGGASEAGQS